MSSANRRTRRNELLAVLVFAGLALAAVAAFAVTPEPHDGNPSCSSFNSTWTELKVEPVADGEYTNGTLTVTVAVDEANQTFDWDSNIGVDAVFVKGGSSGNLYRYDPEATSDDGLHAQVNPETDKFYGLSHISFCYDTESPPPSESPTPTPTETTPGPTVSPTETTPGPTVSPTETVSVLPTGTTSPSVLGTKVLSNTGADVMRLLWAGLAMVALGGLAYTFASRAQKQQ